MVVAGLVGLLIAIAVVRHWRRRRVPTASSDRWERFKAMGSLTVPLLHDRRAKQSEMHEVRGNARLLFVQVHGDAIVIDGLIGPPGDTDDVVRQPFWLRVRRPGTGWMCTTLESLMTKWATEGSSVSVETRPARDGYQATLSAGRSRMVLEVEAVGGLADAA